MNLIGSTAIVETYRAEAGELVARIDSTLSQARGLSGELRLARQKELGRLLHTLKGASSAVGFRELVELVHRMEDVLRADEELSEPSLRELEAGVQELIALFQTVAGNSEGALESPQVKVQAERVDAIEASLDELSVLRLQSEQQLQEQLLARKGLARALGLARKLRRESISVGARRESGDSNLRLRIAELERSLSETLDRLFHASRKAPLLMAQEGIVLGALRESVYRLRMQELLGVFELAARAARSAASELGKEVEVNIRGGGVEVDRAVIDKLKDSLLHLTRNAVAHGIESAEERLKQGKTSAGCILIEAECSGDLATIRVADDGAGVDRDRVLGRKHEQNQSSGAGVSLMARTESADPNTELLAALCRPGFTTRAQADHLAGRGVGLEAVLSRITELGGRLSLETEPGFGTMFSIEIPVTTSTQRGLIVRSGGELYALPFELVETATRLSAEQISELEGRPTALFGGQRLAFVDLEELISGTRARRQDSGRRPDQERTPAVVLRANNERMVLRVEELVGESPLMVRSLGPAFRRARLFLGGAIQNDHEVLLVLRVQELFQRARRSQFSPRSGTSQARVLVVDDSVTMRLLAQRVLQEGGFSVLVANDGTEALSTLADSEVDLVVTDLQMEPMDGLELTKRLQALMPQMPILMVTTVADPATRAAALAAGAKAYMLKSSFAEGQFLDMARRLIGLPETS